jgi:hypothetical protein
MTPQKKEQTKPVFHYFQMEDLVPADHILRQEENYYPNRYQ